MLSVFAFFTLIEAQFQESGMCATLMTEDQCKDFARDERREFIGDPWISDGIDRSETSPPGCYLKESSRKVYFNINLGSTGECSDERQCACQGGNRITSSKCPNLMVERECALWAKENNHEYKDTTYRAFRPQGCYKRKSKIFFNGIKTQTRTVQCSSSAKCVCGRGGAGGGVPPVTPGGGNPVIPNGGNPGNPVISGGGNPVIPGGVDSNLPGGVDSNFPGGVDPNFPGGVDPNFPGGVDPNSPGGVDSNFPGGVDSNFTGGGGVPTDPTGGVPTDPTGGVPTDPTGNPGGVDYPDFPNGSGGGVNPDDYDDYDNGGVGIDTNNTNGGGDVDTNNTNGGLDSVECNLEGCVECAGDSCAICDAAEGYTLNGESGMCQQAGPDMLMVMIPILGGFLVLLCVIYCCCCRKQKTDTTLQGKPSGRDDDSDDDLENPASMGSMSPGSASALSLGSVASVGSSNIGSTLGSPNRRKITALMSSAGKGESMMSSPNSRRTGSKGRSKGKGGKAGRSSGRKSGKGEKGKGKGGKKGKGKGKGQAASALPTMGSMLNTSGMSISPGSSPVASP